MGFTLEPGQEFPSWDRERENKGFEHMTFDVAVMKPKRHLHKHRLTSSHFISGNPVYELASELLGCICVISAALESKAHIQLSFLHRSSGLALVRGTPCRRQALLSL